MLKKRCFNFFQGNTTLALRLCASLQTKKQTHFCLMLPSNKNQSLAKHTSLWIAALYMVWKHCEAQPSLLTISYSSTSLQNDSGDGAGRVDCWQHPSPSFIISFILFVCLHSPFSGRREVFSAIQLSETSVLCGYCLYGSAVFGVFPLYMFFLNGRAILKRLFASDQSTICNWR